MKGEILRVNFTKMLFIGLLFCPFWVNSNVRLSSKYHRIEKKDTIKLGVSHFRKKLDVRVYDKKVVCNCSKKPFSVENLYPTYVKKHPHIRFNKIQSGSVNSTKQKARAITGVQFISNLKVVPNVVRSHIKVSFETNKTSVIKVVLSDLLGNEVTTILDEKIAAGKFSTVYHLDGKVKYGTYFVRVLAPEFENVTRIVVQ